MWETDIKEEGLGQHWNLSRDVFKWRKQKKKYIPGKDIARRYFVVSELLIFHIQFQYRSCTNKQKKGAGQALQLQ